MLIRSQDKEQLLNIDSVKTIGICERGKCFAIFIDNFYFIGNYSSREKVIKVLDMIQEAYSEYQIMLNFSVSYLHEFKEKTDGFAIFQMPEDSDVEA